MKREVKKHICKIETFPGIQQDNPDCDKLFRKRLREDADLFEDEINNAEELADIKVSEDLLHKIIAELQEKNLWEDKEKASELYC